MKNIASCLALLLSIALCSCDKFTDVHREFIKEGEIIYAPNFDSVAVRAGKDRVDILMRFFNGHNLKQSVVCWNNWKDTLIVNLADYSLKQGLDTIEVSIPLKEGTYSFNIYNIDKFNNRSLVTSVFGSSYGNDFASTIGNRGIKEIKNYASYFEIVWSSAEETLYGNEIRYTDKQTGTETIKLYLGQEAFTKFEFKPKDDLFAIRSVYAPELGAVDFFYSDWSKEYKLDKVKVDRSAWVLEDFSDDDSRLGTMDWGRAKWCFDNDLDSFWQSAEATGSGGLKPFPHWVVIDMNEVRTFSSVEFTRRSAERMKTLSLEIADSYTKGGENNWTKITNDVIFQKEGPATVSAPITDSKTGRYIRVYVTENWANNAIIELRDVQPYE